MSQGLRPLNGKIMEFLLLLLALLLSHFVAFPLPLSLSFLFVCWLACLFVLS